MQAFETFCHRPLVQRYSQEPVYPVAQVPETALSCVAPLKTQWDSSPAVQGSAQVFETCPHTPSVQRYRQEPVRVPAQVPETRVSWETPSKRQFDSSLAGQRE